MVASSAPSTDQRTEPPRARDRHLTASWCRVTTAEQVGSPVQLPTRRHVLSLMVTCVCGCLPRPPAVGGDERLRRSTRGHCHGVCPPWCGTSVPRPNTKHLPTTGRTVHRTFCCCAWNEQLGSIQFQLSSSVPSAWDSDVNGSWTCPRFLSPPKLRPAGPWSGPVYWVPEFASQQPLWHGIRPSPDSCPAPTTGYQHTCPHSTADQCGPKCLHLSCIWTELSGECQPLSAAQ